MDVLELVLRYALAPLAGLAWYMFKKQDIRIDSLEKRANDHEKDVIEMRTEFKFISRDIKEIKEMLIKLQDK